MQRGVVLVVGLGLEELLERLERGGDRLVENPRPLELLDVGLGDAALLVARVEDRRAVLRADVAALAVDLRRVVGDGEVDAQQLAVSDAPRVVATSIASA